MTAETFFEAVVMFVIMIIIIAVLLFFILRSASKGKLARTLILNLSSSKDKGYSSSDDVSDMVGMTGVAATPLRPSGTGVFNGTRMDVVSDGNYVDAGKEIKIINVQGRRIVVEEIIKPS